MKSEFSTAYILNMVQYYMELNNDIIGDIKKISNRISDVKLISNNSLTVEFCLDGKKYSYKCNPIPASFYPEYYQSRSYVT